MSTAAVLIALGAGCGSSSLGQLDAAGTGGGQGGDAGAGAAHGGQGGDAGAGAAHGGQGGAGAGGGSGGSMGGGGGGRGGAGGVTGQCGSGNVGTCMGNAVYTCSEQGTWIHLLDCSGDNPRCVRSGAGATCACVEGTTSCADGFTPAGCNADGTWDAQARCPGIQICAGGACTFACSPTRPNDCIDITTRRTCVDGSLVPAPCMVGYVCIAGQCMPSNI